VVINKHKGSLTLLKKLNVRIS